MFIIYNNVCENIHNCVIILGKHNKRRKGKKMKKLLSFVTLFLISFLLIACDAPVDGSNPAQAIADNIAITFAEGDSLTSVTKNFNVPTAEGDATIAWLSNDTATVSISNGVATVNQDRKSVV